MTAVCENSGGGARWSPDPGDLSCGKPEFSRQDFLCGENSLVPKPRHCFSGMAWEQGLIIEFHSDYSNATGLTVIDSAPAP